MGTTLDPNEIKRFEITEVYAHPQANVDIVLVHGLNGDPHRTWTAKNGIFWPTDLLPGTLKDARARILVYGYNADVYAFGNDHSASSDMVHQHAQTLMRCLSMERKSKDLNQNAIVWVCHSLGGILVKRTLEMSNDLSPRSSDPDRSIFVSTYGIIFLGTPHVGADPAKWGQTLQFIADTLIPKKLLDTEPHLVRTLRSNNETLQNINLHFLDIYQNFRIEMVHEAVKTDLKGTKIFVVDQASASPQLPGVRYYGIEASHSTMCKFESRNSPGYLNVSTALKTWVADGPQLIYVRWAVERNAHLQAIENQARELLGVFPEEMRTPALSNSSTMALTNSGVITTSMVQSVASIELDRSQDRFPVKPLGFRPNSLFKGRKLELGELHRMLSDKKRRAVGVSAVLLQSLPGGGKTHLARQYVYDHLDDYPGGVFWISAKSESQLAAGFWEMASKVALKDSHDGQATNFQDSEDFINVVRDWFSQHHDWLLVLDGILFEDTPEIRRFIPDSTNSSLIYTSTEGSVEGNHHFMNPQVIKLPLLSAREAQELFLEELGKQHPSMDDRAQSMELVKRMDFSPLVIHTAARRLKATGEPLAKFTRSYLSGPKLRELDAYVAVVGELERMKAVEALNLIKSYYIPVEMLAIGFKILDVPTKTFESASGRSLNNTFKILNRFALIERNELVEPLESDHNLKASREALADDLDVIRLHSVVQDFFIDSLRAKGQLPLWLSRAVACLSHSYEIANERIKSKTSAGLVGDYRSYEIHASRLLEHLDRHEKKHPELAASREILDSRLMGIKEEIDRRTKESSQDIVQGRPEAYQTSIFDRVSSSSDTGPETPESLEKLSGMSTWGTEMDKGPFESPVNLVQPPYPMIGDDLVGVAFPPIHRLDGSYESDRDDAPSLTAQPLQSTTRQDWIIDPDSDWHLVSRRQPRETATWSGLHRTTRTLEMNRYRDTAGAWRAVNPAVSDPRVDTMSVHGYVNPVSAMLPRGRPSGRSQAEVALNQINKSSPPPVRGGGHIRDRSHSSVRKSTLSENRSHLMMGQAAQSSPITSEAMFLENLAGWRSPQSSSRPSPRTAPATLAMASLQQMPRTPSGSSSHPSSPGPSQHQSYHTPYDRDISGQQIYPKQTGPLPIEYVAGVSSPLKRDQPHDNPLRMPNYPQVIESSGDIYHSPAEYRRLHQYTAQNIQDNEFLASNTNHTGGYTSQPMSRDPSGQSAPGDIAAGIRRPSLAETEPAPKLPTFSPQIPPTSYQMYENMRDTEEDGRFRKSPRLGFARAAQIERVEEWTGSSRIENVPPQYSFNPSAPEFLPGMQAQSLTSYTGQRRFNPFPGMTGSPRPPTELPAMSPSQSGGSGSGGVRIGHRMIEFGDFPEPVDFDAARERNDRQRADAKAFEEGLFRSRARRGSNVPRVSNAQKIVGRAVTDVQKMDLDVASRPRGLSSPENEVGLGLEFGGVSGGC